MVQHQRAGFSRAYPFHVRHVGLFKKAEWWDTAAIASAVLGLVRVRGVRRSRVDSMWSWLLRNLRDRRTRLVTCPCALRLVMACLEHLRAAPSWSSATSRYVADAAGRQEAR